MVAQLTEASSKGCSIIVFPELATTGYLPPGDLPALAEPVHGGSISTLAEACAEHDISAVVGFPQLDSARGVCHNSFVFLSRTGEIVGIYHKTHLWETESQWAEPGESVPTFDHLGTTYGGWICFDTRFPEVGRIAFLSNVEVCFVPTAWLGPAAEWELSLRARALDNCCFIAGADLINPVPGLECRGHSMIVGPSGEVLCRAQPMTDCVIDAVLDPNVMMRQRERLRIRECRRPELYGALSDG
jgi:predicted amidohydrolase